VETGADYIGLVFYPGSHRYIDPERAREVADTARATARNGRIKVVGLFVNEPLDDILRVREAAGLDIIQLSGNESTDDMAALTEQDVPFVATVRGGSGSDSDPEMRFREVIAQRPEAVHFDTHVPGMWGGSGVVGDWNLANALAREYRLFLAGGLDPENVADAVREVRPYVVDVSSGVETNKIKDHTKIRAFIAAARGAEGEET